MFSLDPERRDVLLVVAWKQMLANLRAAVGGVNAKFEPSLWYSLAWFRMEKQSAPSPSAKPAKTPPLVDYMLVLLVRRPSAAYEVLPIHLHYSNSR